MAGAAHHIKTTTGPDLGGLADRVIDGFLAMISSVPNAIRAAREAEELLSLTDAELAARGLTRDGVAQHVVSRCLRD